MNAAWCWLTPLPLAHMYLITPRPSVPPRAVFDRGEKAEGGRPDFIWLILDRTHEGKPIWGWLHRDERSRQVLGPKPPYCYLLGAETSSQVLAGLASTSTMTVLDVPQSVSIGGGSACATT